MKNKNTGDAFSKVLLISSKQKDVAYNPEYKDKVIETLLNAKNSNYKDKFLGDSAEQEHKSIQEEDVEHSYQTFGDSEEDRLDDFWYEDSDSAIEDLERNSSVGREHFKKSRFKYFRDIDFVCEVACRSDYQNLKYCSKKMRDNASVVSAAMYMCDEHQERLTLLYASKRIQDKVKSRIKIGAFENETKTLRNLRVYEALLIIAKEEKEQGE